MLSWSQIQTRMEKMAVGETTAPSALTTFLEAEYNIGYKIMLRELNRYTTEEETTVATVEDQDEYEFPARYTRVKTMTITPDSVPYPILPIYDQLTWDALKTNTATSDQPNFYFAKETTFELYPTPSEDDDTITIVYEATQPDLANDDYTTGTITTLANGSAAVTGDSTVWTTAMQGRFFKIDNDGTWYEIETRTSNTAITLVKNYEGTAIAAGTESYTIGEMPALPEEHHITPAYYALSQYYRGQRRDHDSADRYISMFNGNNNPNHAHYHFGVQAAKRTYGKRGSSAVIHSKNRLTRNRFFVNPNSFPVLS